MTSREDPEDPSRGPHTAGAADADRDGGPPRQKPVSDYLADEIGALDSMRRLKPGSDAGNPDTGSDRTAPPGASDP